MIYALNNKTNLNFLKGLKNKKLNMINTIQQKF